MARPYREGETREETLACMFCGDRVEDGACISCREEAAPAGVPHAKGLDVQCPRCFIGLELKEIPGDAGFLYCIGCHGCFVPPVDFARMLASHDPDAPPGAELVKLPANQSLPHGAVEKSVACPVCHAKMRRAAFANEGETIDVCILHGIWFDAAELASTVKEREKHEAVLETPQQFSVTKPSTVLADLARYLRG